MSPPSPADLRHFEALYAASDDPWQVRESWYERRKRDVLLACLDRPRYAHAFEPGCGNGEMSAALARRCDAVLACDGAANAVAAARARVDAIGDSISDCHIRVEQRRLPDQLPQDGRFDLIVVSELAYYFDAAAIAAMVDGVQASLMDGGLLVLCHWRHDFADRVSTTEAVHAAFGAAARLRRTVQHLDEDFLLEAWIKSPAAGLAGAAA